MDKNPSFEDVIGPAFADLNLKLTKIYKKNERIKFIRKVVIAAAFGAGATAVLVIRAGLDNCNHEEPEED